jgi:CHAT domain-containing protein
VARADPARDLSAATFARRELARWLFDTDPAASFALVDEAIVMSAARGDLFGIARGRMRRAFFVFDDPSLDTRTKAAVEAADAIERIRDLQPDALSQARTFGEWGFFYYHALDALLGAAPGVPELDAAFSVAERLRSQVLRSELDAAGATPYLESDDPVRAEHQRTLQALASVRRTLAAAAPGDVAAARDEVTRLESRADELRRRILATSARIAEIWGAGTAGIDEVRASLAPDQALFAYVFPPAHERNRSRPRAFVVSSAGAQVVDLRVSPAVDSAIVLLEGAISRRDGSERAALATLHGALVEPCLAALPAGVRRVVVVPDGALHRVPLEALAAGGGTPFGLQFEVSRTPSATLWLRWRNGTHSSPPRVIAIGDPATEPRYFDDDTALGTREALGPLARARREARAAAATSRGSRALTGDAAGEGQLKRAPLPRYGVIHVAAHAVVDERSPSRSAVLLRADEGEDGLLHPGEITTLRLDGQLVVLSACRTAEGAVLAGEGPMSLARSFLAAGAHAVVGSLWPLWDAEAESMAARFYERMVEGATIGEALTAARRDQFEAGRPVADWAGLIAIGDTDRRPLAGARRPLRFAYLGGAVVAATALVAIFLLRGRASRG